MPDKKIFNDKKITVSGYRVLELLKALSSTELSTQEMLEIIEEKTDNVYRKELVTKYLNTLRLIGFQIEKVKDKYILKKGLKQIDFSYKDLSVLSFISQYINDIPFENLHKNFHIIMNKLQKCFSQETIQRLENTTIKPFVSSKQTEFKSEYIRKFEKYCEDGLKLTIEYQNSKSKESCRYKILPIKIIYKKRNVFLVAYDCINNEYKEFLLDFIVFDEQTPQKSSQNYSSTVTFKLYGRLSKSYVLKSCEQVLEYNDEFVVISNTKEDKDMLIRRLARYYDKCEILYPQSYREKMLDYLNSIEMVYENGF